jgi:hypothetical protein
MQQTDISPEKMLQAVEQMNLPDLEEFVNKVIAIQASKRAPHLSDDESELFNKINRSFPADLKLKLDELTNKRMAESLRESEYQELAALTDKLEEFHAERMEALVRLAEVRGTTLDQIMKLLGIKFPDHG